MKLIRALYLVVFGLGALSNAAPSIVNTAMDLKRNAEALPKPLRDPLPVAEPSKRDAEALPEPYPEAISEPQRPAKRDADADARPEPYPEAIPEPQRPART